MLRNSSLVRRRAPLIALVILPVANPTVTVEYGTERFEADAEVITGEEHDRLYAKQAVAFPGFGEYQKNTSRVIPVIALNRKS